MSSDRQTVLLVDRDNDLLNSLSQLFENDGYSVLAAHSCEAAVVAFQQHNRRIDFLVTDIDLGLMNGFDLAIAVATEHPSVTVIFTVPARSSLRESMCDVCRKAATYFLPKPFLYPQLRNKLVQLSEEADGITLEWLMHCYEEPVRSRVQPSALTDEQHEEVHPITLHLDAVAREDILLVKGLVRNPEAGHAFCLIEPQIKTLRHWRPLRLTDLEYTQRPALRLVVRLDKHRSRRKEPPTSFVQLESTQQEPKDLTQIKPSSSNSSEAIQDESMQIVPLQQLEKEAIIWALTILKGDKREAAKKLGISRTTIYHKLREYGIVVD